MRASESRSAPASTRGRRPGRSPGDAPGRRAHPNDLLGSAGNRAAPSEALALQRMAGNRATTQLVQREVINMDPITVTSSLPPIERAVSGLQHLRGQGVDPAGISITHDVESIRRNAPAPSQSLPFRTGGGWNAQAILTALGQYDTMSWTDSDALRCVQAVALASRVVEGPQAVSSFIGATILEGMLSRSLGPRERAAIAVLQHVRARIESGRAVYGDLLGAQEALHDLFYNDVTGTPEPDILQRVAPTFDLGFSSEARSTWFSTPEQVLAEANRLQRGEQLLLNTWKVVFNEAFDQLSEQGIEVPEGRSITVNVDGRRVRIRRIDTATKPPHTRISPVRDKKLGHQLLILKDASTGDLRLYEPEITESGQHLQALTADVLEGYFRDLPDYGIYNYMQILGKLTPSALGSGNWPSP